MGNEARKDELDGSGVCFNFTVYYGFSPLDVDKYNTLYSLSHGTSIPDLTYQSMPQYKTQQLAYVLWFIIQRRVEDSTPQAISSLRVLISHLNSENAYLTEIHFNNDTFIFIMTFFPTRYSNLI